MNVGGAEQTKYHRRSEYITNESIYKAISKKVDNMNRFFL